jgi:hypothetical protein
MGVVVDLEPPSAETKRILTEWQAGWGALADGGGIELAAATSLSALLDLRLRCYDRGINVNAVFPYNQ